MGCAPGSCSGGRLVLCAVPSQADHALGMRWFFLTAAALLPATPNCRQGCLWQAAGASSCTERSAAAGL